MTTIAEELRRAQVFAREARAAERRHTAAIQWAQSSDRQAQLRARASYFQGAAEGWEELARVLERLDAPAVPMAPAPTKEINPRSPLP